ncbi:MAG: fumarylacetoacetate hydrolase family protein [Halobacteriales archaeon]
MRYFSVERGGETRVVVESGGEYHDLTAETRAVASFADLARIAAGTDRSVRDVAGSLSEAAPRIDPEAVAAGRTRPVDPDEVWAAGVTYAISQEARQEEGGLAESYLNAYEADRPEVYFKATPSRTVGPGEAVGIRGDSAWDVPEPELAIVLYHGDIVGFTVGNDVCSREIERENLLYLPQSKIYARCCAVGPCVADVADPHDLEMSMRIEREGSTVFEGETTTAEMVRTVEELAGYFTRHNEVPELAVLLTGTSIIPPNDVTLQEGDDVSIHIEEIGTLDNPVIEV